MTLGKRAATTATSRIVEFSRDDLVFQVADTGPADGAVVVLLHGWPQDEREWGGVVARLNANGYRTIVPLQRGYSPGAQPRSRRAYRLAELAKDIVVLIDAHGLGPVHLVGHDWGAAVGWQVAAAFPDRLATFTAVSVPHPLAFARAAVTGDQLRRSWYMALFQFPWIPEWLMGHEGGFVFRQLVASGQTPERAHRDLAKMADRATARGSLNYYRAFGGDPASLTKKITVPTLMVGSDGDVAVSPVGWRQTAKHVASPYSLEVLPGVSHWIPDEAPELLAELVLWHISNTATR